MNDGISAFFKAKGVAIIGASTSPKKLSHGILKNLIQYHYEGKIYPINPGAEEILGLTCYKDIGDVPDPVELAVIVLPAGMTPDALRACGKRGIKAVVIISGGFKEVGEEGAALERECLAIAQAHRMRLIGPNCVGTMDITTGLNTTFIEGMPPLGPIGFISQSGAVCGGVVDYILEKNVGFSHFASLGNALDVTEADVIAYFGDDPAVKVIAVYVEGISNGQRFIEIARSVSRKKPIVLLKAGRTDAGAKAVSSHTGSLAGSYAAYQAAFAQCGIIEVQSVSDLFDVAWALGTQPLPKGSRAAIITNAGGPAALASDALAMAGFSLASIDQATQNVIRTRLNPSAQAANPIDMLGGAEPDEYDFVLNVLNQYEGVDVLLPILVPQALVNPLEVAKAFAKNAASSEKTMLSCMFGEAHVKEARHLLHRSGVPMFTFPESLGVVLHAMMQYRNWRDQTRDAAEVPAIAGDVEKTKGLLATAKPGEALGEVETRPILEAYHINIVPGGLAKTVDDAVKLAESIGYPVVMKIVSKQILHKSDSGGIALGLQNADALRSAHALMLKKVTEACPQAIIDGVMIQKMAAKSTEVIVGMKRDDVFGAVLMFGMGGIYVELFKDIAFGIAPLSPGAARAMIEKTHAGRLLSGYRGSETADIDAVVDVICRLGQLALDHPEIAEMEINPLGVYGAGDGCVALDARMIIRD